MSVFLLTIKNGCGNNKQKEYGIFFDKEKVANAIYKYIQNDKYLSDYYPDDISVYKEDGDLDEDATYQKLLEKCFEIVQIGGVVLWCGDKVLVEKLQIIRQL